LLDAAIDVAPPALTPAEATSGFGNRLTAKTLEALAALVAGAAEVARLRDEHQATLDTRPPPTPEPQDLEADDDAGYDALEQGEGEDGEGEDQDDQAAAAEDAVAEEAEPPAPPVRKTRAQRRLEAQQRKEDVARGVEILKKEHAVFMLKARTAAAVHLQAIKLLLVPASMA
jgi:hypothetical protein